MKDSAKQLVTSELIDLARTLADWAALGEPLIVYLFGSRVRGDHRPDSDVDILVDIEVASIGTEAVHWYDEANESRFTALDLVLPGPLNPLDPMDKQMCQLVRSGKVIHVDRNVRCILMSPKTRRPM